MHNNEKKNLQKYQNMSTLFISLICDLKKYRFDFCAYVVEEAYCFYNAEMKKRLENRPN